MDPLWYLVTFLLFAVVGVLITDFLCRGCGPWSRRVADTRFRWGNAPVGASVAAVGSWFEDYPSNWFCITAAVAMFITALGWAWVYPAHD